jgi:translocation and assembly module TamB
LSEEPTPEVEAKPRRRWVKWLLLIALLPVFVILAALWAVDTGPGHRFLTDRLARIETNTGLRFHVGRIDGSIYSRARLRDVRVYDPRGLLFEAPEIALDWRPTRWLANTLDINSVTATVATLHKKPELRPGKPGPILPGFDIRIGGLRIDRLRIDKSITGRERVATLNGSADIRSGRAMVKLDASAGTSDRIRLDVDAMPDGDRFDVAADVRSDAGGVIGGLVGTRNALALKISGDGKWHGWAGKAQLDIAEKRVADLDLTAKDGVYTLVGKAFPAAVAKGKLARLTEGGVDVKAMLTLANRKLDTDARIATPELAIGAVGVADLAAGAFDDMRISLRLLKPQALFPNMTGRDIQGRIILDGPFATAGFQYVLASPHIAFDKTGFDLVQASGRGRLSALPITVPVSLKARRVTGVGDVAGGILANLSVNGQLRVNAKAIFGDGLRLRSDKLNSTISLFVDLATGRYEVGLQGQLSRYLIPGLGIVDVKSSLKVVPGPGGKGTRITGSGQAWVRRFDNAFLAGLAGGLPRLDTRLERTPDGIIHFVGLKIVAPALTLTGNGYRRLDGSFHFEGQGTQAQYGPLKLVLNGQIDKPTVDIILPRPLDALGLKDVRAHLQPDPQGFLYRAEGGSTLGPFTANGAILMPKGQPTRIRVAALDVSGTQATGELVSMPGGFDGQLKISGGGVTGDLRFDRVGQIQRIAGGIDAQRARFAGPPPITARRLSIDGTILLDPAGLGVDATVSARGLRRGTLALSSLAADVKLKGGSGTVRAAFAGQRGRAFDLQTVAQVTPDRISVTGGGTIDQRPVKLNSPAVLSRDGGAWRLAPTAIAYAGGQLTVGGRFGDGANMVGATLQKMPLAILDIAYPDLGLAGAASGKLSYSAPVGGVPSGQADIVVRGLSRSGLVLSSQPIDVGIKAVLSGSSVAARAVAASGGKVIGRAQARLAPLGEGALMDRLSAAPLFAQLRYNGPADTLWRLAGTELFDISGPLAIGADIGGTLGDPRIKGSLRTDGARLQSAVSGTVLTNMKAGGRFDGSRLIIDNFSAKAGDGSVSGRGSFEFSSDKGIGIDLALQADNAELINRDDIGATVTGPLSIKSEGRGGVLGGDVQLIRSRYRLGKAQTAAAVPRLPLTEINRRGSDDEEVAPPAPWRLALKANARNRMMVTGLGLDSEWRAVLDIGGTLDAPQIVGQATLLRGDYEFAGRSFELDRGTIRFAGGTPIDPLIDISASANLDSLSATIRVSGTGLKPEISFTSTPALPEDELLSRLLFGTSITNLSAPEALQLASAVAGLQSNGGLDPINKVRSAVGLDRLRIIQADPTLNQGTSIAAGKYVTRRIYVEVITDGQGYSATRAEFQFTRWLSLLSTISTLGRSSVNVRVSKDY